MTAGIQWKLQVDWDNDGTLDADEGPRMVTPGPVIVMGRDRMFDSNGVTPQNVGTLSLTLDNRDDRFTPWFTTGPLYGNLKPNRRVYLTVVDTDTTVYVLFHGFLKSIDVVDFVDKRVKLVAEDGWRLLKNAMLAHATVLSNVDTGAAIDAMLNTAAWPAALGRSINTGSDVLPYAWAIGPADVTIRSLADSEFGQFVTRPGSGACFFSRNYLQTQSSLVTLAADKLLKDKIVLSSVLENIKNGVTVKAHPITVQPVGTLWRLSYLVSLTADNAVELLPEYTFGGVRVAATSALGPGNALSAAALNSAYVVGGQLDLTNGGGGQVWLYNDGDWLKITDGTQTTYVEIIRTALLTGTQTYQTRVLSGTTTGTYATGAGTVVRAVDYAVNSQADGLGLDLTAQVTITTTIYAQSAKLVVTLISGGAANSGYILFMRMQGAALSQPDTTAQTANDGGSQVDYGVQSLTLDLPWQQNPNQSQDLAVWAVSFFKDMTASPRVSIENRPSIQFLYDLADRITLSLPTIGLARDYRIGRIQHSWKNGLAQAPLTEWTLEPVDATAYFILDTNILDGDARLGY